MSRIRCAPANDLAALLRVPLDDGEGTEVVSPGNLDCEMRST